MVSMILIGSGGGGGSPTASGVSLAGGGGGGSAGVSTLIIPAMFLPDTLYINLQGGGVPSTTSSTRGSVYVSIHPTSAVSNELVIQSNNGGRAGSGATGSGGGSVTGACIAGTGIYKGIAGNTGGTSAAATNGGNNTFTAGTLTFSGGGGGGTPAAAGSGTRGGQQVWSSGATWPDRLQVAGGGATSNGADGYWGGYGVQVGNIPVRYGGVGGNSSGGSAPAASGGQGGAAAASSYGAGGGGGGAGLTTAGGGGRGCGAYCRIVSW